MYKHIEGLQGVSIPKFLGYGNLCGVVDILILEDCGELIDLASIDVLKGLLEQIRAKDVF